MNCHQCSAHIPASDRSEIQFECSVCDAIFSSSECFQHHAVEMVKKETREDALASKEKNDL